MNDCKLFSLPDDLQRDIFREWLVLSDIPALDTACCSKKFRDVFLNVLSSGRAFYNVEEDHHYSLLSKHITQCICDEVEAADITFRSLFVDCFSEQKLLFTSQCVTHLTFLVCRRFSDRDIADALRECGAIVELKFDTSFYR